MVREFSGVAISFRYFLAKVRHSPDVRAFCASFTVAALGARFGYQTSYQFWEENRDFGTPRGGRRTVPTRMPSLL